MDLIETITSDKNVTTWNLKAKVLLHLKRKHDGFAISAIIMAIDVILPKLTMFRSLSDTNCYHAIYVLSHTIKFL